MLTLWHTNDICNTKCDNQNTKHQLMIVALMQL